MNMYQKPYKFTVSVFKIKSGNCKGLYDCKIWINGVILQYSSGTAFEFKDDAKAFGDNLKKKYEKEIMYDI